MTRCGLELATVRTGCESLTVDAQQVTTHDKREATR